MRGLLLGLAALGSAVAPAGCGSASGSAVPISAPTVLCAPQPKGALCIKVLQDGHVVHDVIGYLAASDSPLAGKTWRLVLGRYACDPLAQELGSFGDWSGFVLPRRFTSRTWLCVAEQIRAGNSWRPPDRALATSPVRACAELSPA